MPNAIEQFRELVLGYFPGCKWEVDEPDAPAGNSWINLRIGKKHLTLEYRPGRGFGLFSEPTGYGEEPSEVYRTPKLAARRLVQLMNQPRKKRLDLKDIRELYEYSQVELAAKVGVKQSAISRFENRAEVKLSTLAAAIEALGGKLEVRAHFSDSDVPISTKLSAGNKH